MDIALARTFLEIVACGNFVRAAQRLHLTQTAVSVRVRTLEQMLGQTLFVRTRRGAALTPAGEQFLRYAPMVVQVWERARQQVSVPPGRQAMVALGGELSLWDPFLLDWLVWMRRAAPALALRTQVGLAEGLIDRVSEGILDLAVVYSPQYRPGLRVELLMKEKLVLVTTERGKAARDGGYVYVDWGPEFAAHHNLAFPERSNPGVHVDLGPLGLQYILRVGGSGYFRLNVVKPHLAARRLSLVRDAPEFLYPAYLVYSESADAKTLEPALTGLRHVAARQSVGKRARRVPRA